MKAVHILRFSRAGELVDIDLIARPAKGVIALGNGVGSKTGPQIKAALEASWKRYLRCFPSITTIVGSAASKPSNNRALTPMRRVTPSHLPSGSKAGLSL
jgi:hypothetical protein